MSFWVHACCNNTVASVTSNSLMDGIHKRLKLLTYLFCPENEEDPDIVFNRLRFESHSTDGTFQDFRMYYRINSSAFIHIKRNDKSGIEELEQNLLAHQQVPGIQSISQLMRDVTEDVTFCLKSHDVKGMGFPLAIAAAAHLVDLAGGLIQSGTYSWMIPSGNEVKTLLEIEV